MSRAICWNLVQVTGCITCTVLPKHQTGFTRLILYLAPTLTVGDQIFSWHHIPGWHLSLVIPRLQLWTKLQNLNRSLVLLCNRANDNSTVTSMYIHLIHSCTGKLSKMIMRGGNLMELFQLSKSDILMGECLTTQPKSRCCISLYTVLAQPT